MPGVFKRIVTGHDANGAAIIVSAAPPPRVQRVGGEIGPVFYEVWNTTSTPARIDRMMSARGRHHAGATKKGCSHSSARCPAGGGAINV
jgi:hypothetical protein